MSAAELYNCVAMSQDPPTQARVGIEAEPTGRGDVPVDRVHPGVGEQRAASGIEASSNYLEASSRIVIPVRLLSITD